MKKKSKFAKKGVTYKEFLAAVKPDTLKALDTLVLVGNYSSRRELVRDVLEKHVDAAKQVHGIE